MKFVQFIRDELVDQEPIVQFNFSTLEELINHPHIARFTNLLNFKQFSLDGFFLLAESGANNNAVLIGFIYGKDKCHLNLPVWGGSSCFAAKTLPCNVSIGVPKTAKNVTKANTVVPIHKLDKWVFYWKDGTYTVLEGHGVDGALSAICTNSQDPDLDFYHLGDTPTHRWNNADKDWEKPMYGN